MEGLVGSALMGKLVANRLVIKMEDEETIPSAKLMGLTTLEGLHFRRDLNNNTIHFEILFELVADMEIVQQHLSQYKMGMD